MQATRKLFCHRQFGEWEEPLVARLASRELRKFERSGDASETRESGAALSQTVSRDASVSQRLTRDVPLELGDKRARGPVSRDDLPDERYLNDARRWRGRGSVTGRNERENGREQGNQHENPSHRLLNDESFYLSANESRASGSS